MGGGGGQRPPPRLPGADNRAAAAGSRRRRGDLAEGGEAAHAENAVPGTATEYELIDDLRRRANEAGSLEWATKRRNRRGSDAAAAERPRLRTSPTRWTRLRQAGAADAAESAVHEKERATGEILGDGGCFERDMAAVARAEAGGGGGDAGQGSGGGSRSRPNLARSSRLLAEAKAECAEHRGAAAAATDALEEAFASARAVAGREASAREAQARAEARLAAAGAATAAAEERAARADDLEIRAQTAEARLETQAREGARAVARAQAEASEWRARRSFGRGSWRLRGRPRTPPRASRPLRRHVLGVQARTSGKPPRQATRTRTRTDCPALPPSSVLSAKLPRQKFHNMTSPYARQYHDFSTERGAGGARPAPALPTADFLDRLAGGCAP